MGLHFFITQNTMGTINIDWTLADINMSDLACACGYLVAEPSTAASSIPNSSYQTTDGAFQSPNLPHGLVWPTELIEQFRANHVHVSELKPKDTEVG
jgi:hypothetical protein